MLILVTLYGFYQPRGGFWWSVYECGHAPADAYKYEGLPCAPAVTCTVHIDDAYQRILPELLKVGTDMPTITLPDGRSHRLPVVSYTMLDDATVSDPPTGRAIFV